MLYTLTAKSFLCGIALLIPGIGATSAAIALGVLDRLTSALQSIKKQPSAAFAVLIPIAAGGLSGAALAAKPISMLCESIPTVSSAVFFVLSLICVAVTAKKYIGKPDARSVSLFVLGTLIAAAVSIVCGRLGGQSNSAVVYILSGVASAAALILPGISFSYTLLAMGVYDIFLRSFYAPEITFILPFFAGLTAGAVILLMLFRRLLARCGRLFYAFICGMMLFSAIDVLFKCIESAIYR